MTEFLFLRFCNTSFKKGWKRKATISSFLFRLLTSDFQPKKIIGTQSNNDYFCKKITQWEEEISEQEKVKFMPAVTETQGLLSRLKNNNLLKKRPRSNNRLAENNFTSSL